MRSSSSLRSFSARPRLVLSAMLCAALTPVLVAWGLTSEWLGWRPERLINHGTFMQPLRRLATDRIGFAQDGTEFSARALEGRWSLVILLHSHCDAQCQLGLARLNNARLALGKNVVRTLGLVLLPSAASEKLRTDIARTFPLLEIIRLVDSTSSTLTQKLICPPLSLYVVDPGRQLPMCFAPDVDFVGVVKDLKRLLAASSRG